MRQDIIVASIHYLWFLAQLYAHMLTDTRAIIICEIEQLFKNKELAKNSNNRKLTEMREDKQALTNKS